MQSFIAASAVGVEADLKNLYACKDEGRIDFADWVTDSKIGDG